MAQGRDGSGRETKASGVKSRRAFREFACDLVGSGEPWKS